MTPQSVRMMKDARLLAWPWMAVTSAVLLSLTSHLPNMNWSSIQGLPLVEFGVFAGVPLLAAIGFGAEFQYHTLDLSLAQPIDRGAIWSSKFSVMVLAVLPLAVLFSISQRLSPEFERNTWLM